VIDAAAHIGDRGSALDLADVVALDVGDQQAGRVGSDIDYGNAHRDIHVLRYLVTRGAS
jgi:hypothetical protein